MAKDDHKKQAETFPNEPNRTVPNEQIVQPVAPNQALPIVSPPVQPTPVKTPETTTTPEVPGRNHPIK